VARIAAPEKEPPATPRTEFGKKVQAHQRYYTSTGEQVAGVTTILNVLAKPALVPWANRLGLQGIDTSKYVDEAAMIGTLAHYLIECSLKVEEPDLRDFTQAQVERAAHGVFAFNEWRSRHSLDPLLVEEQLVSDAYRYGGTIDCLCLLDGQLTLVDLKTSSGIWPEHKYQLGAYWQLLREHGHQIKGARILRIGRTEGEGMEEHTLTGTQVLHGWRVFEHCLAIYELKKKERRS
jgi:hypothetical protein